MTSAPFSQKRELGQHFLVDENILGVIGRLAEIGPRDVVLEVLVRPLQNPTIVCGGH